MSAPVAALPEPALVDALRELYRGTSHEGQWFACVRPRATGGRTWELWTGSEHFLAESAEQLLRLAKLAYCYEPDEADAP